jgi:hypothetical protein
VFRDGRPWSRLGAVFIVGTWLVLAASTAMLSLWLVRRHSPLAIVPARCSTDCGIVRPTVFAVLR